MPKAIMLKLDRETTPGEIAEILSEIISDVIAEQEAQAKQEEVEDMAMYERIIMQTALANAENGAELSNWLLKTF